jgi:hypothetical protein
LKLREPFTFLTDRCLGKYEVPDAVRAALEGGERVERLDDHYAPDAADALWIPERDPRRSQVELRHEPRAGCAGMTA